MQQIQLALQPLVHQWARLLLLPQLLVLRQQAGCLLALLRLPLRPPALQPPALRPPALRPPARRLPVLQLLALQLLAH